MPNPESLSVIVVTMDRAPEIAQCLESLLAQRGEALDEIVVVLNDATSEVRAVVDELVGRDARVSTLTIERSTASVARNLGVEASRGELLYFIDDDVMVDPAATSEIVRCFAEHPEVGIVGGPNLTPPDDPPFAHLTGALLSTRWGTGATRSRYIESEEGAADERHLILCNLAMRRAIFTERGLSFPTLFGGEENALMGQAASRGVRAWYSPRIFVHHRRRTTFAGYCEQIYRYGWGRANAMANAPGTARLIYFVPVGFLLYLLALPLLSRWSSWALLPLMAYGAGTFVASLGLVIRDRRPAWLPLLLGLYPITHVVYAAGLIRQGLRHLSGGPVSRKAPERSS